MFSDVPEMFSDVPEMFSDVLSCFQMFSVVFRFSQLFSDVLRMPSIDHRYSIEILRCVLYVLRCSQMIRDVFGFYLDIL